MTVVVMKFVLSQLWKNVDRWCRLIQCLPPSLGSFDAPFESFPFEVVLEFYTSKWRSCVACRCRHFRPLPLPPPRCLLLSPCSIAFSSQADIFKSRNYTQLNPFGKLRVGPSECIAMNYHYCPQSMWSITLTFAAPIWSPQVSKKPNREVNRIFLKAIIIKITIAILVKTPASTEPQR